MGMFDSLYDSRSREWQTKAFDCLCDRFEVGDLMPEAAAHSYQVEVIGGEHDQPLIESLATVRDNALVSTNGPRDERLPLLDYHGTLIAAAKGA